MASIFETVQKLLLNPIRVGLLCVLLGFLAITYDGSLYRYWSLKSTEQELVQRISQIQIATKQIKSQIEKSKSSEFIEREARERLDLVGQDEIVFLFSEDTQPDLKEDGANLR